MVNLNGTLFPADQTLFKAGNRAFLYGDRLFETIRYQNGKLLFWEDHYFRMMGGACILRMEIPIHFNIEFFEDEIIKTIEACKLASNSARVHLSIYRADGGLYRPTDRSFDYLIEVEKLQSSDLCLNDKGLEIDVFHDHLKPKQALSNFKGANSMISVLSSIYAHENGLDEAIILNSESHICETTASNIFVVIGKSIYTPALSTGCVDGIVRKQIIENASSWGYTLEEKNMKTFELIMADEIFLTNSIRGIQWVSAYKNKTYRNEVTSGIFDKLQRLVNA